MEKNVLKLNQLARSNLACFQNKIDFKDSNMKPLALKTMIGKRLGIMVDRIHDGGLTSRSVSSDNVFKRQ